MESSSFVSDLSHTLLLPSSSSPANFLLSRSRSCSVSFAAWSSLPLPISSASSTKVSCTLSNSLATLLTQLTTSEPSPVVNQVEAFAPATVANLGPGFDFLGCAVDGMGDTVRARVCEVTPPGDVSLASIDGDGGKLSADAGKNCAGIAAKATMELLGVTSVGIALDLHKGLPLGSGLGSSAASAAASAMAVNAIFGNPLSKQDLVLAGLVSEASVSGYHADNVAPSLLGGFILVNSYHPLRLIPLSLPPHSNLFFVLVSPDFEAPTKKMRAVLPSHISMADHISNCSHASSLVSAVLLGDLPLLGKSLSSDTLVEPKRMPLIPGMAQVKEAALHAGAFGCTISGAGPTAVAITDSREHGLTIGEAMVASFYEHGKLKATAHVQQLDRVGARTL